MKKLAITTFALAIAISGTAEANHHKKGEHYKKDRSEAREYRIGDPTVVYSEIGSSGSQNGNTIIPDYGQPVRSQKPYEVRYDYQDYLRK